METVRILETKEISHNDVHSDSDKNKSSIKKIPKSFIDKIIFWILITTVFLTPLFFVPFSSISIEAQKSLFLAIVIGLSFFLWILARLKTGVYTIPKSPILLAGFFVLVIFFVSALFSSAVDVSLSGFSFDLGTVASILILFLTLFLSSIIFQSKKRITFFYRAIFASFTLLFVFHLIRLIFGVDVLSFGVFFNTTDTLIGKWNDIAVFAGMMALLSLISLEFNEVKGVAKYFITTTLVVALLTLIVINLSLAWTLLGFFTLVVIVYNLTVNQSEGIQRVNNISTTSLGVLLLSILFVIGGGPIGGFVSNYTNISQLEVRPSWGTTFNIIGETWKNDPLLGSGPNRFINQWVTYKPADINNTIFWNTDFRSGMGIIPSYAVTTGVLGIIAFIFFLGLILYQGIRVLFIAGNRADYFTFSSLIVSIYLWTTIFFFVSNITIVFLAFMMTGIFIAFSAHKGFVKNINLTHMRDRRISFVSVLVLILLLIGMVQWEYVSVRKSFSLVNLHKGITAFNQEGDLDKAEKYIIRATELNNSDTLYRALTEVELSKLNALLSQTDSSPEKIRSEFQETLGNAINAAQSAVQFDETNYQNWVSLFQVYGNVVQLEVVDGAYENALASLKKAQEVNPTSVALILSRAQLEIAAGNISEGKKIVEEVLVIKNNYTDAIFLLAQLEIQEGNTDAAILSLESATLINPNNVSLFFSLGLLKYNDEDYNGAIDSLERVVVLNTQYSNAMYFLGLSYYFVDRNDDAIIQFENVSVINPDNEDVKTILENLKNELAPFSETSPSTSSPDTLGEPPLEE